MHAVCCRPLPHDTAWVKPIRMQCVVVIHLVVSESVDKNHTQRQNIHEPSYLINASIAGWKPKKNDQLINWYESQDKSVHAEKKYQFLFDGII